MNKLHIPRIYKGLDQQGRYPEAAHAASESDEDAAPSRFAWDDVAFSVGVAAVTISVVLLVAGIAK